MKTYPLRPTICEIDLDALRNNFDIIRRQARKDKKILAVVKANAYGHGAIAISRAMEDLKADFLGVAILEEALQLRNAGIRMPILILGGIIEGQEPAIFDSNLIPVVYSLIGAGRIDLEAGKRGVKGKIHVKIDTGMGRIGIKPPETREFFKALRKMQNIEVEGLVTHFASADALLNSEGALYTEKQIKDFLQVIDAIESVGFDIPIKHAANSAAVFHHPSKDFNMVRPGIMLYGAYPSSSFEKIKDLKGVMSLRTKILEIRDMEKGAGISYNSTYITPGRRKIAVIPIGYADGYRRELSNRGEVLVRGRRAKVVGKVCMDMTLIDVTDVKNVRVGDDVYLFGGKGDNIITADEIAELAGTIPYEIFCGISERVPRVYTEKE